MANPLSAIAIQQFRDIFTVKYQATEKLAGTALEVHGAIGDAYKWPRMDGADMRIRTSYGSLVPATIVDHTQVTTTFEDYVLNLPVDRGEQTLVNANERAQLAGRHAEAIGRRKDKWKIDALAAASINTVPVGTTNMTLEKLIEAKELLMTGNAPTDNLVIAIHANQLSALLKLEKLTSADYNTIRALVAGEINTFMGFRFIVFGDVIDKNTNVNLGLPKTGDDRDCFAWHEGALGAVFTLDPKIDVEWSPERVSWLSISQMIGGASPLLEEGIVKIVCDETA
jgi:hypothetical protein